MTVARATRRFCRIPLSLLLSLINLLTDRSTAAERRTRPRWCRHEHDVVSIQQQLVWSTRQITQLLASPTTSRDRKHSTPTAGSVVIFAAIIPTLADRTQVSLWTDSSRRRAFYNAIKTCLHCGVLMSSRLVHVDTTRHCSTAAFPLLWLD